MSTATSRASITVALPPGGHQVAYRLGGPADHGDCGEATTATTVCRWTPRAINPKALAEQAVPLMPWRRRRRYGSSAPTAGR